MTGDTLDIWRHHVYQHVSIRKLSGKNVLDVGCGEGVVTRYLATIAKSVIGFDIEASDAWNRRTPKNLKFTVADAQMSPFKRSYFTGVFLQDMLHHVENPQTVLREIDRVTKPGSVIILVEANRYNPIFYIHMTKMRGHEHFPFTRFQRMVTEVFPQATFRQFESHYIPFLGVRSYLLVTRMIEWIFNSVPILNRFKSYNCAIIEK